MRRLAVYFFLVMGGITAANAWAADPHDSSSKLDATSRLAAASGFSLEKLELPNAADLTPKEACNLAGMVMPFCNALELKHNCEDLMSLSPGAYRMLTEDESKELRRKIPSTLNSIKGCFAKLADAKKHGFLAEFKKQFELVERKKELIRAGCDAVVELATSGSDSGASTPTIENVDFENPCLSIFQKSNSRTNACFRTGSNACNALTGNVELENLIPPDIYEASVASGIPIDLPEYLKDTIDGSIDVFKKKGADKLNDFVSRKVVAKAGPAGAIALATITAASKQIYSAYKTGNNDWAHCLGSDNAGACFHDLFMGGIPKSSPLARPTTVDGKKQIECCYCKKTLFAASETLFGSEKVIRVDDDLTPIEVGPLVDSYCKQQENHPQEKYLASHLGRKVYYRKHDCQKATVSGESCLLTADTRITPVEVIKEESAPVSTEPATTMAGSRKRPRTQKRLFAAGMKNTDPKPSLDRLEDRFTLPPTLAPKRYDWKEAKIRAARDRPVIPVALATPAPARRTSPSLFTPVAIPAPAIAEAKAPSLIPPSREHFSPSPDLGTERLRAVVRNARPNRNAVPAPQRTIFPDVAMASVAPELSVELTHASPARSRPDLSAFEAPSPISPDPDAVPPGTAMAAVAPAPFTLPETDLRSRARPLPHARVAMSAPQRTIPAETALPQVFPNPAMPSVPERPSVGRIATNAALAPVLAMPHEVDFVAPASATDDSGADPELDSRN